MNGGGMQFTVPGQLEARLRTLVEQGVGGANAAILALGPITVDAMKSVLGESSHSPRTPTPARQGGPPARVTGTLANSIVQSRPLYGPTGMRIIVKPSREGFYAYYLENGWVPLHGSRAGGARRRSPVEKKQATAGRYGGQVRYPFVEDVERKVRDEVGAVVARYIRFTH